MKKVILQSMIRQGTGKEYNKKLRAKGEVPAVVYKRGTDSITLQVEARELFRILHTSAGENVIITLQIKSEGKQSMDDKTVIVKEVQHDPVKGDVLHVDFNEISLTEKIVVNIPVHTKGEAERAQIDEGVVDHPGKEIEIECLPTEIPEKIEVYVGKMKIGDSVRARDLTVPEGIKVLTDPDLTIVSVVPPHVEKPAEEGVEGAEITEPEVIREKKSEEGEEEGEDKPESAAKKE